MRSHTMDHKQGLAKNTADMTWALLVMGCLAITSPARAQTTLSTFDGDSAGDEFGISVSGAGDINGDGFADLIVGAPFDDNNGDDAGSARVLSGLNGSVLYTFNGDAAGDTFGRSVSGAGDVNGDGFADLIVGAPNDASIGSPSGSARVFSGLDGSILYTFYGDSAVDQFGFSVSGAGDVNGDGFADLIVGAPFDDVNGTDSGSASVFSGFDGSILYTFDGDSGTDMLGTSVSGAGDVDGDGFADLIVGAFRNDNNGSDSGSAWVFSGFNGSILYTFNGDSALDFFGFSVSGAGDVDGDGHPDLIVGARLDDNNGSNSGSARVFSGFNGSILYTLDGDSASDQFGTSVSGAGDVDGDGFADLIVGARRDDNNGINSGSARVFSGADGSVLYTFDGDSTGDEFGFSVSGAGDVDGDGCADIIVGAYLDDNNGTDSGNARVISVPCLPSDPVTLLENVIQDVVDLNLQQGINNSLDAKLDAAAQALEDMNANNDAAACNALQAFINAVQGQSGNQIPGPDADALVAAVQQILDALGCG